jgi:hypothetical protein
VLARPSSGTRRNGVKGIARGAMPLAFGHGRLAPPCRPNGLCHRSTQIFIAQHWDDLLRLAGSLKLGVVQATSIMRMLQIGDLPTKTRPSGCRTRSHRQNHSCLTYIDDESKRRRTLNQLNRGERKPLKRVFCSIAPDYPRSSRNRRLLNLIGRASLSHLRLSRTWRRPAGSISVSW